MIRAWQNNGHTIRRFEMRSLRKGTWNLPLILLILALAFGVVFGTGLCSRLDLAPAAAGVFACVLAGFVGGICAIALLDGAPTGTRHKLLRIVMLWAMLLVLHYSSALQSPIPELLTAKREFREKQQETANAYLLFEKCREAGNHSSGLVDEQ